MAKIIFQNFARFCNQSCNNLLQQFSPRYPSNVAGIKNFLFVSGNAVALALREVDMAVGTDTGCSIRVPSALCGCVGLKPTYGLVPMTGCMACIPTTDHVGPMATSVQVSLSGHLQLKKKKNIVNFLWYT